MSTTPKTITAEQVTLPKDSVWRKIPLIGLVVGVLGLGGLFAMHGEHGEAEYAYLIAYMYFLSIAIGAAFFLAIFYVARGGWHIALRRIGENIAVTMPLFALLFVPIALKLDHIYLWADAHEQATSHILHIKEPFLNVEFFLGRAAFYLAAMTIIAVYFYRRSVGQDETGDHRVTTHLQAVGAPATAIVALVSTFMALDWMMSTDYHWFSTIYGVVFFGGSFMAFFAVLALVTMALRPHMGGAVSTSHLHGTGKMMWGLMVFWAYVAFSQFMLIWYADIPEETAWFEIRWAHGWKAWTLILFFGHFVIPFFAMMSRHVKRNPRTLAICSVWLLAAHYVDIFWQVKPNMHHGHGAPSLGLLEVLAFVGVGGLSIAAFAFLLGRTPLVPVKDPRLPESLAYEEI